MQELQYERNPEAEDLARRLDEALERIRKLEELVRLYADGSPVTVL